MSSGRPALCSRPMPRRFLIDGYNLAFAWEAVRRPMLIDKEKGREKLIELLAGFKRAAGCDITVVFDSRQEGRLSRGENQQGIKLVFSKKGSSADEEIYRILSHSQDRGSLTVVSSDRQVAGFARRQGASAMGSGEFATKAERTLSRKEVSSEKPEPAAVDGWLKYFREDNG